jgi:deoxycytidine triphosphate deaminase
MVGRSETLLDPVFGEAIYFNPDGSNNFRHEVRSSNSRPCFDSPTMSTTKTLDIRIGAVKRLTKEMKSRRVDVETEKKRTERLISEGEDQWTVGKQVSIYACYTDS